MYTNSLLIYTKIHYRGKDKIKLNILFAAGSSGKNTLTRAVHRQLKKAI